MLLQTLIDQGRDVILPVGCDLGDEWLLDRLDCGGLIQQVKLGGKVDLTHLTTSAAHVSRALASISLEPTESQDVADVGAAKGLKGA
jgi:hypothetical protein